MKILSRNDFINEVYEPMMREQEEKEYRELQSINEGILKNLFGKIRSLFVDDWKKIKGDENIKNAYKEYDDSLTGFASMKMSKRDQCNQIRQELVNFACDWYDYMMDKSKKKDSDPELAKDDDFKSDVLKDNVEGCKKNIKNISDGDAQMNKWAETLMGYMRTAINRVIVQDIDDEEKKQQIEEEEKEAKEKADKINKILEPEQKKLLDKISKEREKYISNVKATPMKEMYGDKAIQNIYGEFKKLADVMPVNESYDADGNAVNEAKKTFDAAAVLKVLQNDNTLGLKGLFDGFEEDDINDNKFKLTYSLMKSFYDDKTGLSKKDNTDLFKKVPGGSVQAMCIAVNSFLKYSVYISDTDRKYTKEIPLMSKCAIVSNDIISYGLPIVDEENGINYFARTLGEFTNTNDPKFKNIDKKVSAEFSKNAKIILNKIKNEAKKLKEKAEKDYNDMVKKIEDQIK